jgi:hypothetical protein
MTPFRYFRPLVVGCALALVALALASEVAASAGPVANVAAGRSAAAILNRCTPYPHPTMPPSTGTQTPSSLQHLLLARCLRHTPSSTT